MSYNINNTVRITNPDSDFYGELAKVVDKYVGSSSGRQLYTVEINGETFNYYEDSLEYVNMGRMKLKEYSHYVI